jgi:hypothetical protein
MLSLVRGRRTRAGLWALGATCFFASTALADPHYELHGYLSQGYAISSALPIYGIPTQGTTDWRRAALQLRMSPNEQDQFIVQLRQRRLGNSPQSVADGGDVSLDWGFIQHSFGQYSVRAGRMPMPRGIYNQVRDVGVILPFYRAPYSFYMESFEIVEGAQISGRATLGHGFNGEAQFFAGESEYRDTAPTPGNQLLLQLRLTHAFGAQAWLETPVQGLRIGAYVSSSRINQGTPSDFGATLSQVSLDGSFERCMLRGEYRYINVATFKSPGWHGQAGLRLTDQLWVYGQYEWTDIKVLSPFGWLHTKYARDAAGSVVFKPNPAVALKIEGHQDKGYNSSVPLSPLGPPGNTNYLIASVSMAY